MESYCSVCVGDCPNSAHWILDWDKWSSGGRNKITPSVVDLIMINFPDTPLKFQRLILQLNVNFSTLVKAWKFCDSLKLTYLTLTPLKILKRHLDKSLCSIIVSKHPHSRLFIFAPKLLIHPVCLFCAANIYLTWTLRNLLFASAICSLFELLTLTSLNTPK